MPFCKTSAADGPHNRGMTDHRVGRHVRIYEWDEVDETQDATQVQQANKKTAQADKKAQAEQPKGLGGLFKRKLF